MIVRRIHAAAAGIAGAGGVALAAVAAHAGGGNLGTAADFLLFHAPVFLLLATAAPPRTATAGLALVAGVGLFAADLVARGYLGVRLFPLAAPAGGLLTIAGWAASGMAAFLDAGGKTPGDRRRG